jgi:hypothetical protein
LTAIPTGLHPATSAASSKTQHSSLRCGNPQRTAGLKAARVVIGFVLR